MTTSDSRLNGKHFHQSIDQLLGLLDARSKDIIVRRYGLESQSIETLDSIGREYGITRERVRQIESQAKKLLARRQETLDAVARILEDIFARYGGALAEEHLLEIVTEHVHDAPRLPLMRFYLDVLPPYQYISRSSLFAPHWLHPELATSHAEAVVVMAETILAETKEPIEEDRFVDSIREATGLDALVLSDEMLFALLKASKRLKKTVFGEWGLINWVETTPRGVSDKAYVVLRRNGKPLHFRDITKKINEVSFDHKRAHEQTVHNELIKDDRFVLVGRGLYGLKDWGYIPGTVADVLEAVLAEAERPLTRDELLDKVLEQRMVKKTTVLLGLQNSDRFQKMEGGRYSLRKT